MEKDYNDFPILQLDKMEHIANEYNKSLKTTILENEIQPDKQTPDENTDFNINTDEPKTKNIFNKKRCNSVFNFNKKRKDNVFDYVKTNDESEHNSNDIENDETENNNTNKSIIKKTLNNAKSLPVFLALWLISKR